MHTTRFGLIAALIGATVGACQCAEPLQVLAPKIQIGDPYDATFSVCQTNFVKDCAYDYGDVGIGRPKLFSFVIKNPTNVDLNIKSITIDGSPNFTLDGAVPDVVDAATGAIGKVVTVKYDPKTETAETATVVITTDAQNIPAGENVEIALSGNGKDLGCPTIAVNPGRCDFGAVGVGAAGNCSLSLENTGNQELQISGVRLSDDTPQNVFHPGFFIVPAFVEPGTATTVAFSATPDQAAQISGTLIVTSTDCSNPETNVPLIVTGANTPTAVARVKSINGTPNSQQTPPVEPLDDVVLSGDQSVAGTSGATITEYSWTIIERPSESTAVLSNATSMDTGFEFDSANGTVSGLDVAGTFRIRLTVTDSNGATSQNDATVVLNVCRPKASTCSSRGARPPTTSTCTCSRATRRAGARSRTTATTWTASRASSRRRRTGTAWAASRTATRASTSTTSTASAPRTSTSTRRSTARTSSASTPTAAAAAASARSRRPTSR